MPASGSVMQIARMALAAAHRRQDALLDVLGRIGRDDPGLHPDLAEHRHRGHVAGLGDLLEHERGVEHRQAEAAILLGHRHAEHAELRRARFMFSHGKAPSI